MAENVSGGGGETSGAGSSGEFDISAIAEALEGIAKPKENDSLEEVDEAMEKFLGPRSPLYKLMKEVLKTQGPVKKLSNGVISSVGGSAVNGAIPGKPDPIDQENKKGFKKLFKTKFFDNVLTGFKTIAKSMGSILFDLLEFFLFMAFFDPNGTLLRSLIGIFLKIFVMIVKIIIKLLPTAIKLLFETAKFVFQAIIAELPGLFGAIADMLGDIANKFAITAPFLKPFITFFNTLKDAFSAFNSKDPAKQISFKDLALRVGKAFINLLFDVLVVLIKTAFDLLPLFLDLARQVQVWFWDFISSVFSKSTFEKIKPFAKKAFTDLFMGIFSFLNLGGDSKQLGKDFENIMGFLEPFFLLIGDIAGSISGFFKDLETMSFKEALTNLVKNLGVNIGVALARLGSFIIGYITSGDMFKDIGRVLNFIADLVSNIVGFLKDLLFGMIDGIFGTDSGVGAFLKFVLGGIIDLVVMVTNIPLRIFGAFFTALGYLTEAIFVTIPAFFVKFGKAFFGFFDLKKWVNVVKKKVDDFINGIKKVFDGMSLSNVFSFEGLTKTFSDFGSWLKDKVKSAFSDMGIWFGEIIANAGATFTDLNPLANSDAKASAKLILKAKDELDSLAVSIKNRVGEEDLGKLLRGNANAEVKARAMQNLKLSDTAQLDRLITTLQKQAEKSGGSGEDTLKQGFKQLADAFNKGQPINVNQIIPAPTGS